VNSNLRYKRSLVTFVATVATATTLVVATPAWASQGGNRTNFTALNGSRVYITRNLIESVNGAGAILFVRTQSAISQSAGLFQTGYHRSLLPGDNCALDGGVVNIFVEWRPVGGAYNCTTYFNCCAGARFAVVQQPGSSGFWGAYVNGELLTPTHNVNYNTGYALVGGEWQGSSKPGVSGCFGCGGQTAWQYTSNNGGNYTTITGIQSVVFNDGGWSIGTPPSPFTIKNF